jgi:hypothetical protein
MYEGSVCALARLCSREFSGNSPPTRLMRVILAHIDRAHYPPQEQARNLEPQEIAGIKIRKFDGAVTWNYID